MFKRIDKKAAEDKLTDSNSILVDIRDFESYEKGHIGEAVLLTQDNISDFVINTEKDTPILVMCYHGNSSQAIARYLNQQGFSDVYSIDGGYEGWIEK